MRTGLVCVGVAWAVIASAGAARADAQINVGEQYQRATKLLEDGEHEQALELIDRALVAAPKELGLLRLKGAVMIKLHDYLGALAAHQAYLDAGAVGANRREAQKIVDSLLAAKSTFLEISLANGPADIYLDSKTQAALCRAETACHKPVLPGEYKVIAERPGFERWTGRVTIEKDATAKLAVVLIEQRSRLTVRAVPPGPRITVDGAVYDAPTSVPPGAHQVVVTLAGHKAVRREVIASKGKPIELDIALVPLVPLRVDPAGAVLLLDGTRVALADGHLEIPPGRHVLVARAKGFRSERIEIPAARGAGYQLAIELRPSQLTAQRKLALAVGGVGLISVGAGVRLGLEHGQFRTPPSQLGYGFGGFAVALALVLWREGAPRPRPSRIHLIPRLGSVAGLELAVGF
jgi:hypothetical protein